ncbi:MAG: hypothetical protein ABWX87_11145, partial [Pseudoxanthomonas sp.]
MTLPASRPRLMRGALSLAVALVLGAPGLANAADFTTSFESGQPQAGAGADDIALRVGTGPAEPYAAKPNAGYSGVKALRFDARTGGRSKLFDVDVTVD